MDNRNDLPDNRGEIGTPGLPAARITPAATHAAVALASNLYRGQG